MTPPTHYKPVPIIDNEGQEIGTATVAFDQDVGTATMRVVDYGEQAHGKECFFVVETENDGSPRRVLAFQIGQYAPVGPEEYYIVYFATDGGAVETNRERST